jgi:uncharacterized protein YaiL (DUF2058 family)
MQSLKDKLLQAGLVTEEPAKRAEAERARPPRREPARPKGLVTRATEPSKGAPIPKLPPLPLSDNKAYQREVSRKQLELDRAVREKVMAHEVEVALGDHPFYFVTRKGRLRRLDLTQAQAKALEGGGLAVVERPDPGQIGHALVPGEVAVELCALSEKVVRFLNRPEAPIGFLSDEELAARQEQEARSPPEVEEPSAAAVAPHNVAG